MFDTTIFFSHNKLLWLQKDNIHVINIHVIIPHFAVGQGAENHGRILQTN
jgi:hypothetical protein